MKYIFSFLILISVTSICCQISPLETKWIDNGLQHSAEKAKSFENIELLFDSSKISKFDYFPDVIGSYNSLFKDTKLQTGFGIAYETGLKKKLAFQLRYTAGFSSAPNSDFPSDLQTKAYFMNHLPKNDLGNEFIYNDLRFRLTYRPIKQVEFQTGIDRQHFGEGDRSEMMGFQMAPAPFIKAKGNIWRLQYQFMHQLWSEGMFTSNYRPKGVVSHYLSYKVIPSLHIGLFESVIYGIRDTLYNRGFEFEYLNPFIFFRPQEYGLGSSDNVILGADISYQFQKNMIYSSFIIDDFSLKEIRARNRWWANKYTFQLGIKSLFYSGEHKIFHRFEANLVRPFTYSQLVDDVVYGNEGIPTAHPLGANFFELYDEINWKYKKWDLTIFVQGFIRGTIEFDLLNSGKIYSTGGNIYLPYTLRKEEYNYTIGRGMTQRRWMIGTHLAFSLHKDRWQVFVEPRLIIDQNPSIKDTYGYLTVGIHRPIGANRRNY